MWYNAPEEKKGGEGHNPACFESHVRKEDKPHWTCWKQEEIAKKEGIGQKTVDDVLTELAETENLAAHRERDVRPEGQLTPARTARFSIIKIADLLKNATKNDGSKFYEPPAEGEVKEIHSVKDRRQYRADIFPGPFSRGRSSVHRFLA